MKIYSLSELYSFLPEDERVIVDVLREIVKENIPDHFKEKISYNVPYFYGKRGLCIIWPAAVPRGGIESGVLFGFSYGNLLSDDENYLEKGTNKQVFYKIFNSVDEIETAPLIKLIRQAVDLDESRK